MAVETILMAISTADEDRIDEIVENVLDVAEPTDATVVLAHVFDSEEYRDVRARLDIDAYSEVDVDEVAARHTTTRSVAKRLDAAGIDHEIRGAVGEGADAIVNLAETAEADLVVVGGRKRTPAGKAIFGSTAQEVMLSSPCPVTFVRAA